MNIYFKRWLVPGAVLFPLLLLSVVTMQDIKAETLADEMRNKSQQCAAWANTGEVTLDKARFCIISCRIDEAMLTDENVQKCREEYSSTQSNVAGIEKPEIVIVKPPGTIEEMVVDMNKAKQEYKVAVENAATSASKKLAQNCHDSCARDVKRISRQGTSIHRAEAFWVRCTKCGDTEPKQYTHEGSRTLINNEKTKTTESSMPDIEGIYFRSTKSGFLVRADDREDWKTYCNEAARIKNGKEEFSRKIKSQDRVRLIGVTYDPSKTNKKITRCYAESVVILGSSKK